MRIALTIIFLLASVLPSLGAEYGTARSRVELKNAVYDLEDRVRDYNRSLEARDPAWIGILVYCVCAEDRGLIIWAADVVFDKRSAGPMTSRLKDQARDCGGCFNSRPTIKYVNRDPRAMRKRRERAERHRYYQREKAKQIRKYLK
ncbi:hypothetical protein ACFL2Q_16190 [Thermodesulfobacteriota bacterium]